MRIAHIISKNYDILNEITMSMCLAQIVAADNEYARHYREFSERPYTHLIMDNGLAEDGKPVGIDTLLSSAERVIPDIIVLPDVLEPAQNLDTAQRALEHEGLIKFAVEHGVKLMYVPHGNSLPEWTGNLLRMPRHPEYNFPNCIGISKFHSEIHPLSSVYGRGPLGTVAHGIYPDLDIHYLGLSLPPMELIHMEHGQTCDTCLAVMSAAHGIRLSALGSLFRPDFVKYDHTMTLNEHQVAVAGDNFKTLDTIAAREPKPDIDLWL